MKIHDTRIMHVLFSTNNLMSFNTLQYKKSTGEPDEKKELLKKIKEITAHRAHLDTSVSTIEGQLLADRLIEERGDGMALMDDWDCLKSMVIKKTDLSCLLL